MAATHELSRWPLFVSFVTTVTLAAMYVFSEIDKECDLRASKICEKKMLLLTPYQYCLLAVLFM